MEFSRGKLLKIEDFSRGGAKKMEFFGGEALISTKFFRGIPIFFGVRTHILQPIFFLAKTKGKSSTKVGWKVRISNFNAIAQCTIIYP